jgi:hypothetical protein
MTKEYSACLDSLVERVEGKKLDEINEDDRQMLRRASAGIKAGEDMYECRVGDCQTEYSLDVLRGVVVAMGYTSTSEHQPCIED